MPEARFRDLVHDQVVITFDGNALEVFTERHASVKRFHVSMLDLSFDGPDRNGRYRINISTGRSTGAGFEANLDAAGWGATHEFWTEVHRAVATQSKS